MKLEASPADAVSIELNNNGNGNNKYTVTGLKEGTVTLHLVYSWKDKECKDQSSEAYKTITVTAAASDPELTPASITVQPNVTLDLNGTTTFDLAATVQVLDEKGDILPLSSAGWLHYLSDDPETGTISVSEDGQITAFKKTEPGRTIQIAVTNDSLTAVCEVTVVCSNTTTGTDHYTAPTKDTDGLYQKTCDLCGEVLEEIVVPKTFTARVYILKDGEYISLEEAGYDTFDVFHTDHQNEQQEVISISAPITVDKGVGYDITVYSYIYNNDIGVKSPTLAP